MKLEKKDIEKIYDEVDRRLKIFIEDGEFDNVNELKQCKLDMMQGVYSALMILSANDWPNVRYMCDKEEEKRNY